MKRGLITWDKSEIPPEVFARRVDGVRRVLSERGLDALLIYTDLGRSDQARFFSNVMLYFNRALLIIPRESPSVLLCGLSPRVYGWIRSVSTVEDIRSAGNFAKPLSELAAERKWTRIGALEFDRFPYDLYASLHVSPIKIANVEAEAVFNPDNDETELAMKRKAYAILENTLNEEIPRAIGIPDHHLVGRLERRLRLAGAEDLIVRLSSGNVSVALEYRGHWTTVNAKR